VMNIPHLATVDSAGDSVYRTTSVAATRHPKNSTSFTYFYAFSKAAADSAIAHTMLTYPSGTLGTISNVNNVAEVKVYPNPSKDQITITGLTATDHVALYDMMGRSADQNWSVTHDGNSTFRYNNVPAGAYVVVVTDAGGNIKSRVPVRKN
jgi:Secretion system C-terminal sorting domain